MNKNLIINVVKEALTENEMQDNTNYNDIAEAVYNKLYPLRIKKPHYGKTCYIAGKIGDLPLDVVDEKFDKAKRQVSALNLVPISPRDLLHNHDKEWQSYMREDIITMMKCQMVFACSDWRDSPGATIEVMLALQLKIPVIYQSQIDMFRGKDVSLLTDLEISILQIHERRGIYYQAKTNIPEIMIAPIATPDATGELKFYATVDNPEGIDKYRYPAEWQYMKKNADWSDLPIGTKAQAIMGGYWIKREHGWQWNENGGVFPRPGGDASGMVKTPIEFDLSADEKLPTLEEVEKKYGQKGSPLEVNINTLLVRDYNDDTFGEIELELKKFPEIKNIKVHGKNNFELLIKKMLNSPLWLAGPRLIWYYSVLDKEVEVSYEK